MLDESKIIAVIEDGATFGYKITKRDVVYCAALRNVSDINIVYQSIFGVTKDKEAISLYNESALIEWLKERLRSELEVKIDLVGNISNEENAAGLENLLKEIKVRLKDGELTYKEYADLELKTRQRLAALNGNKMRIDEQYIRVSRKYNTICPHCNREYDRKLPTDIE